MTFSLVWADDLTGAAEAAHTWQHVSGRSIRIRLGSADHAPSAAATVWDLDLRHETEADVRARLAPAAARLRPDTSVFFKLDSQLRGPVHAYASALLATGRSVVLSAANPALGRITAEGDHHVPGVAGPPTALRSLFAGLRHEHLRRQEYDRLPGLLTEGPPTLITADVLNEPDLTRLADLCRAGPAVHVAGSAPFLGALAQHPTGGQDSGAAPLQPAPLPQLLAVIGSTDPAGHAQVAALSGRDPQTTVVTAPPSATGPAVAEAAHRVRNALARGVHTVLMPPEPAPDTYHSDETMAALAAICYTVLAGGGHAVALYLSGGHTARRLLDRLGLTDLRTVPGARGAVTRLLAPDGRTILTKPGSYGDRNTLLDLTTPAPPDDPPIPDKEPSGGLT